MPKVRRKVPKIDYVAHLNKMWQKHLEPRSTDAPTVISTFAGGGGSSLGYSMAGYKELLAVEMNNNAVETFKLNFPDVPIYHGDIAKLSVEECLKITGLKEGELDVFDGSPPCQGFSMAGKREFFDDRNQLFREYARLLNGLKPKVFIMENVSSMVHGGTKLIFAEVLRALKDSGYKVSVRIINAMYFHVPQSRERIIFIGVRNDLEIEPTHPKVESYPLTVRQAIGELSDVQDKIIDHIWIDEIKRGTKLGNIKHLKKVKPGKRVRPFQTASANFRLFFDKPSRTLNKSASYVQCNHAHPVYHRALSVREYARIGSFPDLFKFSNSLNYANKIIGNSVPPLMMEAIARHVKENILSKIGQC